MLWFLACKSYGHFSLTANSQVLALALNLGNDLSKPKAIARKSYYARARQESNLMRYVK
jgi:hypothetical protein